MSLSIRPPVATPVRTLPRILALLLAAALSAAFAAPASAQRQTGYEVPLTPVEGVPPELEGVDIVEQLGNVLPLDATFVDDSGAPVALRQYFDGKRPVVLQIGYLKCPMLCNMVLNELVKGLKKVDWSAGEEFEIVSVSVNPIETHELAKVKKDGYLMEYGRPETSKGWHFLTGPAESSKAVADATGFRFRYVPETGEYAHAAAVILCTPDGRVSRYLYGVQYEPRDLKMGLLEASDGKMGTSLERFILWCHQYDPNARGYVLFALRLMKLGGVVTLTLLFAGLSFLWFRDFQRRQSAAGSASAAPGDVPPPATPAA